VSAFTISSSERASGAQRSGLRVWPLRRSALLVLLGWGVALFAIWSAFGLLLVHVLDHGSIGEADRWVPKWFERQRSSTVNSLSYWGSMLADTYVKIALIVLVGGAMAVVYRRWHDAVALASSVLLEATVFLFSSLVVGRDRPPVEQLDPIPPSGSFPSGHVAAATAFYGALFMIVCWHTRSTAIRRCFGTLAVLAPIIVATSRIARGMHHPIDTVAGCLLGVASVFVVRAALRAGVRDIDRQAADDSSIPDQARTLEMLDAPVTEGATR
jgi:undecaprenyl-diphosphatase